MNNILRDITSIYGGISRNLDDRLSKKLDKSCKYVYTRKKLPVSLLLISQ